MSGCGSVVQITEIDLAVDAVIFAATTDVLTEALERLSEKAESLGLQDSWIICIP